MFSYCILSRYTQKWCSNAGIRIQREGQHSIISSTSSMITSSQLSLTTYLLQCKSVSQSLPIDLSSPEPFAIYTRTIVHLLYTLYLLWYVVVFIVLVDWRGALKVCILTLFPSFTFPLPSHCSYAPPHTSFFSLLNFSHSLYKSANLFLFAL